MFTVTLVESASAALVAPERGREVETIQIICEGVWTSQKPDPLAKTSEITGSTLSGKFNELVTRYFAQNFGDGGKKYLEFVRTGARVGANQDLECLGPGLTHHPLVSSFLKEMERIVSVFEPSGRFKLFKTKKKLDQVRFRVHRFLEIIRLCEGNKECFSEISRDIHYHTAIASSLHDRKDFDDVLKKFKRLLQKNGLIDLKGKTLPIALPQMVSDCLHAIGRVSLKLSLPYYIPYPCSLALVFYKDNCGAGADAGVVQTETCRVLPQVMKKMAEGSDVWISFGLNRMFGLPPDKPKSVNQHLQDVLKQCAPNTDGSLDSKKTPETKVLINLVKEVILLTLYGVFEESAPWNACKELVLVPPKAKLWWGGGGGPRSCAIVKQSVKRQRHAVNCQL